MLFWQKFLTVNFLFSFVTFRRQKLKKYSVMFLDILVKIIFLQKKKFFYWKWELDSVKTKPHKLGFSTFLSLTKLLGTLGVHLGVLEKKYFFFKKVLQWLFKEQKKFWSKLNFSWKKWSLNFLFFGEKTPFRNFFQQKKLLLAKNRNRNLLFGEGFIFSLILWKSFSHLKNSWIYGSKYWYFFK